MQMGRTNYYTPASFQDVGKKKFLDSIVHCLHFLLQNYVAGHSVTESALAYQATELRVASNITLMSGTADAASY